MDLNEDILEKEILEFGKAVFREASERRIPRFSAQYVTDKLMQWGMSDEELKVCLFRFVDVLPNLRDANSVIRHVQEYFAPIASKAPDIFSKALEVNPGTLAASVAAPTIRKQVRAMAGRFIVGDNPNAALKSLRRIRKRGLAFTVDLLGEATVSEAEALEYQKRYEELIDVLSEELPKWPESSPLIEGHRGDRTPLNISVKLSALYSQTKPVSHEKTVEVLAERLSAILSRAKRAKAFVNVDMEDCSLTSITLDIFKKALSSSDFCDFDQCGIVLQTYLRRTEADLEDLIEWTKKRGVPIAIRLVKGAYWDTETILAKQHGWPIPVWQHKSSSDALFEKLSLRLLENRHLLFPAFGSHNIRSLAHAIKAAELLGIEKTEFELQTLYGMGDSIKRPFVERGYLVREYAPVGELIPGMGYLVRRLLENTANESFLRQSFHEKEAIESLFAKPDFEAHDSGKEHLDKHERDEFTNCALRDFTVQEHRNSFTENLKELRQRLLTKPETVKPMLNGALIDGENSLQSTSPEDPDFVLANITLADRKTAEKAVEALEGFFPTWKHTPVKERAEKLIRAADIMEEQRDELSALIIWEAGKPWAEADGDVVEAIDFLRYYASEAQRLCSPQRMGRLPGENNSFFYEPRGVALVVSPWNFPLAIPTGMFAASLVTGNCAILKPARQTSLIASRLFSILLEAGIPKEAMSFMPCVGAEVGSSLVEHPHISTIAFTGSKEVGLQIIKEGGCVRPEAEHVKRIISEMGGKNAIIIDEDADLDEAVKGVIYSAFGYQGQKCSACSRAIAVGNCYDKLINRLREATKSVVVGPASDSATFVAPVIDANACGKIQKIIEDAKKQCTLVVEGPEPSAGASPGHYVRPVVFTDIPNGHQLLYEEIFGPVLAVLRADNFSQAIDIALDSEYGLTGGVFSRSPRNIELAVKRFNVGNLYINRGCTGAIVMRQPFGGARMSGVGSKAGGPDYLLQFMVPRTVSENTMRRGFAPEILD